MKIIIRDGKIAGAATDDYAGPDEFLQMPEVENFNLDYCSLVGGELVYGEPVPQEVSMGQCRLALFDLHGIKTDAQFYALADVLPEELRPRARLQLSTRQSVRYDNELVIAFCEANDWDRDALFIYANNQ